MPRVRRGRKRNSKFGRLKLQSINKKRDKEIEKMTKKQQKCDKKQKENKHAKKFSIDLTNIKIRISLISVTIVCLLIVLAVSAVPLYNLIKNNIEKSKNKVDPNIYENGASNKQNNNVTIPSSMTLTFLGDIMMTEKMRNSDTDVSLAFKNIAFTTSKTDYTIANISMPITSSDTSTYEPLPSKYISDTKILNGLRALGVDIVNVATDHMLDYGETIFKRTIDILNTSNYTTIGTGDETAYLEKNGVKVAIISQNSAYIGTKSKYDDASINTYDKEKLNNQIKEAKLSSELVIVSLHYGSETQNVITEQMQDMAKSAIDAGADMIVGHHAIGLLPIEIYKGKPIIYSIGYIMNDTKSEFAKQSASFDIVINNQKKISQIILNPVYIAEEKEVSKYTGKSFINFVADYKNKCSELGTKMEIIDERMYIKIE